MEHNASNTLISGNGIAALDHDGYVAKKKKRGLMHVFRVALFMIKSNRSKKSKPASVDTVSIWQKVFGLGSIRPLHMQSHPRSPPPLMESATAGDGFGPVLTSPDVENLEVFTPPMSPAQKSVASSSSSCGMSQFTSATNLQQLDEGNESDGEEAGSYGDKDGDDMIDVKAEQFIAEFYQQMRLQNEVYANCYNRRINGGH